MFTAKTFKVELRLSDYSRAAAVRLLQEGVQAKLELADDARRTGAAQAQYSAAYGKLLACAAELQAAADAIREAQ